MMHLLAIITAAHLAALGQVESGDNDRAIGASGEVSRYQIMPREWAREARLARQWAVKAHQPFHTLAPANTADAHFVATEIWNRRVQSFWLANQRPPTVPELYLLWHRPGRVLHPTKLEAARARRFANLVEKLGKDFQQK